MFGLSSGRSSPSLWIARSISGESATDDLGHPSRAVSTVPDQGVPDTATKVPKQAYYATADNGPHLRNLDYGHFGFFHDDYDDVTAEGRHDSSDSMVKYIHRATNAVGDHFVNQYYDRLNYSPGTLIDMFNESSTFLDRDIDLENYPAAIVGFVNNVNKLTELCCRKKDDDDYDLSDDDNATRTSHSSIETGIVVFKNSKWHFGKTEADKALGKDKKTEDKPTAEQENEFLRCHPLVVVKSVKTRVGWSAVDREETTGIDYTVDVEAEWVDCPITAEGSSDCGERPAYRFVQTFEIRATPIEKATDHSMDIYRYVIIIF